MSLASSWAALRERGRVALIPYITAGFPDAGATRAFLAAGTTLTSVLDLLASHPPGVPVILFSYLNPILAFGPERFAARAREAGAAGVLVVDLPVGVDPAVESQLRSSGLPLVRLVAPTTQAQRLRVIAQASEGSVYLVARTGVTGRNIGAPVPRYPGAPDLAERVVAMRAVTTLPVAVGFGLAEPADAARVAEVADGVIVGSALVERVQRGGAAAGLDWLGALRTAMDAVRRAA